MSATLTVAPRNEQRCLVLARQSDCAIVEISHEALARAVDRMFTPGARAHLQLEMSVKSVERIGSQLELYLRVRIVAEDGHKVDELEAFGSAPALDPSPETVAQAEHAAADAAANDFERVYATAPDVARYLVAGGLAPASAVAVLERGDRLVTVAAAFGAVVGGDDSIAVAPSLRVAVSSGWAFAQLSYSHYSPSFTGAQTTGVIRTFDSTLSTNDIGLEAGVAWRLTRSVELRAGPGIHLLFGGASFDDDVPTPEASFTTLSPGLYGSLATSFLAGRGGPRLALGIEARGYFLSSVELDNLLRTVPAAKFSAAAFLAWEIAWGTEEHR